MKLRSSKGYYSHFLEIKSGQGNTMRFTQIRKNEWKAVIFQLLFRNLLSSNHVLGSVKTVGWRGEVGVERGKCFE